MSLSQIEHDLQQYAYEKLYNLIIDVVQSFDIAGLDKRHSLTCIGASCLRTCALLAATTGLDKKAFLAHCATTYDLVAAETDQLNQQDQGV